MRTVRRVTALLALLALAALAQLNRGSLTGTVSDPSASAVPNVKVLVRNTDTGAVTETVSNESGQFNVPNLPVGPYEVTFEAPSFKRLTRSGFSLSVSQVLRLDVSLELGSTVETVSVTAEVPRLQTDSPEVGTTLSNKKLIDLPLTFAGARLAENFAYAVTPGVSGNSWTSNINGSSNFSKETLLDGATVTTYLAGHFGESSVSVEALSEFRIQTSGMSAEFGRAQAGVFNYVMKSGTNQVHGSAYGALRNEALNANNPVNNFRGQPRPLDRRQNFAFSFGGAVVIPKVYDGHNKTFFYSTYERYRERLGGFAAPDRTAPLPEFLDGDFSRLLGGATGQTDALGNPVLRGAIYDPATFRQLPNGRWVGDMFPGNRIPMNRISAVSRNVTALLREGYLPTVRDNNGVTPLVNNAIRPLAGTPRFDQHQFAQKVDQLVSDRHKLSASYSFTYRPRLLLDQARLWDPSQADGGPLASARRQEIKSQLARFNYDWNVAPTVLNTLTIHYNRMSNPNVGSQAGVDGAQQLGIRNLSTFGYPNINFQTGPFVTINTIGDPQNDFQTYIGFGLANTTSFSRGRHFMKAGVDLRRNHQNLRPTQGGSFDFNPLATAIPGEAFSGSQTGFAFASFLLGIVHSGGLSDPVGIGGRRNYYGFFFQDDFKVSSRLTLNLGLRWEYQPPFYEVADRYSSWNPAKTDPATGLPGAYDFAGDCDICTGKRYFGKRSFRDFGPRLGFAYRAFERTTVRGAYGIMYEGDLFNGFSTTPLGKSTNVQAGGNWALAANGAQPWAGIFNWDGGLPQRFYQPPAFDLSFGNTNRPGMIDPNYGLTPYIQQWNLNVQHQLPGNWVVDAGYVANKSTGLRVGQLGILNQLDPSVLTRFGRALSNQVRNAADAAANGIRYPYAGFNGTVASALRPFPQVQGNQTVNVYGSPLGFSTYHSLQLTVNKEFARGLTTYANYTWSKNLTNLQSSLNGDNPNRPLDAYNLALEKGISSDDQPHLLKAYASYDLPFGRGRQFLTGGPRVVNLLVGGWSVSGILNYFSGTPLSFTTNNPFPGFWNGAVNRTNVGPGELTADSFSRGTFEFSQINSPVNTYLNKANFSDPPQLTLGTGAFAYAQARGFGRVNEDFGLQKNTQITERVRFQLRAEFLNAFNRPQLGGIQTAVTNPQFGQVTSFSGNRSIQLGTRVDF